jgi:L-ascorbate metabolism protein UlaG (beta-lactamase superfamily)
MFQAFASALASRRERRRAEGALRYLLSRPGCSLPATLLALSTIDPRLPPMHLALTAGGLRRPAARQRSALALKPGGARKEHPACAGRVPADHPMYPQPMRVTKYRHACVRLEFDNGTILVIDPGTWSEAEALTGAHAILVTHEHNDHIDTKSLSGADVPVYAPADANIEGVRFTGLGHDEEFSAAGIPIRAVGGRHAFSYDQSPDCANLGYVVADRLYHPGDALLIPDQAIETLLIPMQATWLKTSEAIDFAQAIRPARAFGIHEGQLNERGVRSINDWFSRTAGTDYRWLSPGESW